MTPVVIASPYTGEVNRNVRYAIACMKDSLQRGEAPFASHLLYPFMLDDKVPGERALGMAAGHAWITVASQLIVYIDLGISSGMEGDIRIAEQFLVPIVRRRLPKEVMDGLDLDTSSNS